MSALEQKLRELGRELDLPPAPDLVAAVAARLEPRRRERRRTMLALAFVAAVLAIGIAFAVPTARSAILRFLGFGGVRIERVQTLPPAQERPLGADLGPRVSAAEARKALTGRLLLPPGAEHAVLHLAPGEIVSLIVRTKYGAVLLSELPGSDGGLLKKAAGGSTRIEPADIDGKVGLWLSGAPHVFIFPNAPPRLAGPVLVWQDGGLTLRLEGKLTKAQALEIARSISG